MPVPASINDLSTTAGSNSPPGSESPATIDDYLRAHAAFIAQLRDSKLAASAVSAFMLTVLDDADAATARATLGANNASNLTAGSIPEAIYSTSGALAPTLVNSYTNAGSTYYWKIGRWVFVSINLNRSSLPALDTIMFTLPAGFRPTVDTYAYGGYAGGGQFGLSGFRVATNGQTFNAFNNSAPAGSITISGLFCFPTAL